MRSPSCQLPRQLCQRQRLQQLPHDLGPGWLDPQLALVGESCPNPPPAGKSLVKNHDSSARLALSSFPLKPNQITKTTKSHY